MNVYQINVAIKIVNKNRYCLYSSRGIAFRIFYLFLLVNASNFFSLRASLQKKNTVLSKARNVRRTASPTSVQIIILIGNYEAYRMGNILLSLICNNIAASSAVYFCFPIKQNNNSAPDEGNQREYVKAETSNILSLFAKITHDRFTRSDLVVKVTKGRGRSHSGW